MNRPLANGAERRRLLARCGAVAAALAWPVSRVQAAGAFGMTELMQMLGRARAGSATFVERREVAMLDRTLLSSGRLSFEAPDTFVRETLKPRHEKLAVSGNTLTMSQGSRSRTMELDASPEAAVIVEAVRGTLTGNRSALERHFETRVFGSAEQWRLELVPRDARLRGQVANVKVAGDDTAVREIQVLLADGDRTVMKIEPAAPVRPAEGGRPDAPRPDPLRARP